MMIELVEGKDMTWELGNPKLDNFGGKICELLLHMLSNYFVTGRYVILDSGFVCWEELSSQKRGIFAGALIKKWQYWLALDPGEAIDRSFESKDVGDTDAVSGKWLGTDYFIWGMKEPNYVMKNLGSGGSLNSEGWKEVQRKWKGGNKSYFWWPQYSLSWTSKHWRHMEDWLLAGKIVWIHSFIVWGQHVISNAAMLLEGWLNNNLVELLTHAWMATDWH